MNKTSLLAIAAVSAFFAGTATATDTAAPVAAEPSHTAGQVDAVAAEHHEAAHTEAASEEYKAAEGEKHEKKKHHKHGHSHKQSQAQRQAAKAN